jgi:hypothetical protein
MKLLKPVSLVLFISAMFLAMSGCAPEVGSEAWCEQMKAKDKGDWSANEAADFAKNCLFK